MKYFLIAVLFTGAVFGGHYMVVKYSDRSVESGVHERIPDEMIQAQEE